MHVRIYVVFVVLVYFHVDAEDGGVPVRPLCGWTVCGKAMVDADDYSFNSIAQTWLVGSCCTGLAGGEVAPWWCVGLPSVASSCLRLISSLCGCVPLVARARQCHGSTPLRAWFDLLRPLLLRSSGYPEAVYFLANKKDWMVVPPGSGSDDIRRTTSYRAVLARQAQVGDAFDKSLVDLAEGVQLLGSERAFMKNEEKQRGHDL